jgi:hypothetical protein
VTHGKEKKKIKREKIKQKKYEERNEKIKRM